MTRDYQASGALDTGCTLDVRCESIVVRRQLVNGPTLAGITPSEDAPQELAHPQNMSRSEMKFNPNRLIGGIDPQPVIASTYPPPLAREHLHHVSSNPLSPPGFLAFHTLPTPSSGLSNRGPACFGPAGGTILSSS
jgi:hypothetical protein